MQLETSSRIEAQLKSHVVRIIRDRCTDCTGFSELFLRRGVFVCNDNPTRATYRSTLINPYSNTTSTQLLSYLQKWVSTAPSLRLDWLLVRVNSNCPTVVSSLDVAECVHEVSFLPDSTIVNEINTVLNVCAIRHLGAQICSI